MESDDLPIDLEAELSQQPWWFRWKWRFLEWKRLRSVPLTIRDDKE